VTMHSASGLTRRSIIVGDADFEASLLFSLLGLVLSLAFLTSTACDLPWF
jgi:hypothetical protein